MPDGYYRDVAWPNRGEYWLDQAAADGQLIVCQCQSCRRVVRYLAVDLLPLLGADHRVMIKPPYPCRCGEKDAIRIKVEQPTAGDYGSIDVRRPAGIRRTQLWRTVKLGDVVENKGFGAPAAPVEPKLIRDIEAGRRRSQAHKK